MQRLDCSTDLTSSESAQLDGLACAFAVRFEQFAKLFMKLAQFRGDHHLAIGLVRIIGVILLVISFSFIEVGKRFQSSHDRFAKGAGGF